MPPGKQRLDALLKMCEDCSMTPPTKIVQAANRATQKDIQNPRKKFAVYIDPSQYQIQPNFFLTQNDDPAQQIYEIRNEGSGFIMLTLDAALPWIREIGKWTCDHHSRQSWIQNEPQKRSFAHSLPRHESQAGDFTSHDVAIRGKEHQDASFHATWHWWASMCHHCCYALEGRLERWRMVIHCWKTLQLCTAAVDFQGLENILLATWGKSLRHERQPTSAHHASSVQIHATLPKDKLRSLLVISGFNRM